ADPYNNIKIYNGQVFIYFDFTRENTWYLFKYMNGYFRLTSASNNGVSGMDSDGWDFDFINQKATHAMGKINEDQMFINEQRIELEKLKLLDEMKYPFEWQVLPGVFI